MSTERILAAIGAVAIGRAFGTWLRVAGWPWIVRRYRRLRERWNDYRDYGE